VIVYQNCISLGSARAPHNGGTPWYQARGQVEDEWVREVHGGFTAEG